MKTHQRHRVGLWAMAGLALLVLAAAVHVQARSGDGWLGVVIQNIDDDLRDSEDLPSTEGVIVSRVVKDSPAEKAGLERGDVVLKFDGREARSVRRLTRMIEWSDPGESVDLIVLRDGVEKTISVTIGERDNDDDIWAFGDRDFFGGVAPVPPVAPPAPTGPRVYNFSLGQLSGSYIGVSLYELSEQLAKRYGATDGGALINEVVEDSPAEKAGLKAGDIIVEVDNKSVEDIDEIRDIIGEKEDGETVAIRVLRPLENTDVTVDVKVEHSNTWSGVGRGHLRGLSRGDSRGPGVFYWDNDAWQEARDSWREAIRDSRDTWRDEWRDAVRDSRDEWRDELQNELNDLRDQLKDLRNELREKGN